MNDDLTKIREKRSFRRVLLPFTAGIAAIVLAVSGTTALSAEHGEQGGTHIVSAS